MIIWASFSGAVCGLLRICGSPLWTEHWTGYLPAAPLAPCSTRGSACSVMELSCLFNPHHLRVTRANPVGRQKACCVFVEQLLGSWCTAVVGLVWKWRVTWYFNFFFPFIVFFFPPQTYIADNNCLWRVPASEVEMCILNWGVEFMKILSACKECNFCCFFFFFNRLILASLFSFKIKGLTLHLLF